MSEFSHTWGIDAVFISIPPALRRSTSADAETFLSLCRSLHHSGLKLQALCGDPAWLDQPNRTPEVVLAALKLGKQDRTFGALHLDVEPNAHPSWKLGADARTDLLERFERFLSQIRANVSLPIEVAVNPVLANMTLPSGANGLAAVTTHADSVSLMAYRNTVTRTLSWAEMAIAVFNETNKPWRMGTLVHGSDEIGISYVDKSLDVFAEDMIALDRELRSRSKHYLGIAIEDYHGLIKLMDRSR